MNIMKRILCLILTFVFSLSFLSFAGSNDKEYKKILEKHDVPPEAKILVEENPSEYWIALLLNNDQIEKFGKELDKMKGAEKEALSRYAETPKFNAKYEPSICNEFQGFCDTLLMAMGIADLGYNCSLHVVYSDEVNAFTAPTDNAGFAMCITTGFIQKKGCTYDLIMAAVAHEFAHGVLFHHLRSFYAEAKARRKNELIGGIAMGLEAVAAGAGAYASGITGQKYDYDNHTKSIERIGQNIKIETKRYTFAFSREQEYEADIVAYRFMKSIDKENAFIELLKFLGSEYDFLYNEYSDHPTTTSRIGLIQYIRDHPEIYNKEIEKLRKQKEKDNKKKKDERNIDHSSDDLY